jgi:hypothetical protein
MHACGHDCHTAILMAAAEVLAAQRSELRGTLKLLFQPAEESLPGGEIGGARRMLEEGAFADPKPDAVFGLHVLSSLPTGVIAYRPGPAHASSDNFRILVRGRRRTGRCPGRAWTRCDRRAGRLRPADHPEPAGGRQRPLGAHRRHHPRRVAAQHRPGPGRDDRHAADLRRRGGGGT